MSTYQNFSLPPERFLTVSGNVLYKVLLEAQRADAKRLFRDVSDGKRVKLLSASTCSWTTASFAATGLTSSFSATAWRGC